MNDLRIFKKISVVSLALIVFTAFLVLNADPASNKPMNGFQKFCTIAVLGVGAYMGVDIAYDLLSPTSRAQNETVKHLAEAQSNFRSKGEDGKDKYRLFIDVDDLFKLTPAEHENAQVVLDFLDEDATVSKLQELMFYGPINRIDIVRDDWTQGHAQSSYDKAITLKLSASSDRAAWQKVIDDAIAAYR